MGGIHSGGHNRKRARVDECASIDAGMMRRAGLFDDPPPARVHAWRFTSRGVHTVSLGAQWVTPGHELAGLIFLRHGHTDADGARVIACRVRVSYTACNYGHRRAWLHCPKCGRRVYRLFYYGHLIDQHGRAVHTLQCRKCGGFTYTAWAARGFDKAQAQCEAWRDKVKRRGGHDWGRWDTFPTRPKGMHHATYNRMWRRWNIALAVAQDAFIESVSRMLKLE